MSKKVAIFDSSLRDGAQAEGISFSVEDKLKILELLDGHGVDYIEAGNPGSNPKDLEFFARARAIKLKHSKLAAFGSTRRRDIKVEQDSNVQSLLLADIEDAAICDLTPAVLAQSITSIETNVLRGMDAIHIGSAVALKADVFISADQRQRDAAIRAGLRAEGV
mgnify:CR=1 FL=1